MGNMPSNKRAASFVISREIEATKGCRGTGIQFDFIPFITKPLSNSFTHLNALGSPP